MIVYTELRITAPRLTAFVESEGIGEVRYIPPGDQRIENRY